MALNWRARAGIFAFLLIPWGCQSGQNNQLPRFLGGIDQIIDYPAYLMGERIATASMILTLAGLFAFLFERNRLMGLARRAILYASCVVSLALIALSLHVYDIATMDMVFHNLPFQRVTLNSLALALAIAGIALPLKERK